MKSKAQLLVIFSFLLIMQACGSSDTVTVVSQGPRVGSEADSSTNTEPDFKQLNIGLIEPVSNFDPLFATDLSTMRVLSLIYEGLFTLDINGEPIPSLVDSFEISDDGLQYTFTLNRDIYFHNSSVFNSGIGRRINTDDVKSAFERTASSNVPTYASNLLMNIAGYENYFIEQRNEYDSEKRVIETISGIEVLNPETISITLRNTDDDFLKKLASPYLFLYPREAVGRGLQENPVGTGQYSFNAVDGERITLVKHDAERDFSSEFNRVDFIYKSNERELFRDFARNLIDIIPETGPLINSQILSDDLSLLPTYGEQYELIQNNSSRITSLFLNRDSESTTTWLQNTLSEVTETDITISGYLTFDDNDFIEPDSSDGNPNEEYFITNTNNPVSKNLFAQLNTSVINPESDLTFIDIRVIIPQTTLYSTVTDSFHENFIPFQQGWLTANTPIFNLYHPYLSGVETSNVPWLLFLESIRLDDSEKQPS